MSENNSVISLSENDMFAFGGYTDLEHAVVVVDDVTVLFKLLFLLFILRTITFVRLADRVRVFETEFLHFLLFFNLYNFPLSS